MAAQYLYNQLKSKSRVSNLEILNKLMLKLSLDSYSLLDSTKEYVIYMPDPSDYVVNSDVVAKAIEKGATVVVCEPWCEITAEGLGYGKSNGINVYSIGKFLHKIDSGEEI